MIGRLFSRVAIAMIRVYQRLISPLWPSNLCRFEPTCSHYMVAAIQRKGFWRGILMGTWRILRCNPFSRGGWDPVDPDDRPRYLKTEEPTNEGQ